jgi:hypothetical protein
MPALATASTTALLLFCSFHSVFILQCIVSDASASRESFYKKPKYGSGRTGILKYG